MTVQVIFKSTEWHLMVAGMRFITTAELKEELSLRGMNVIKQSSNSTAVKSYG